MKAGFSNEQKWIPAPSPTYGTPFLLASPLRPISDKVTEFEVTMEGKVTKLQVPNTQSFMASKGKLF